jgi:hypothetical protein
LDEALRGRVREGLQEDLVDDAEDAGICADADGEGSKRYEGEPWIVAQGADGLVDILPQNLKQTPVPHLVRALLNQISFTTGNWVEGKIERITLPAYSR